MESSTPELNYESQTESDEEKTPGPYEVGEKVLAFHNQEFYEAKVMISTYQSHEWKYFVHYTGWSKNWDEWVDVDRLKKYTEENAKKFLTKDMEKNTKAGHGSHKKLKSSSVARGKKRKRDSPSKEKNVLLEKPVNLQIPPILKNQLIDDCEFITRLGKLIKLPRTPNVDEIMKKYRHYRLKKDDSISEEVSEITQGLSCYFNKAMPVMLLYKSERKQYADAIKDGVSPSTIYGAEHLLRLFVKLPELLTNANIEDETLMELQQKLADFLKFLQKNQSIFFLTTYQVPKDTKTSIST